MKNNDNVAMTWKMRWLNRNIATINATFQLLDIYRYRYRYTWACAAFPRYRYDQLIGLGQKVFLPLSLARVVPVSGVSQCSLTYWSRYCVPKNEKGIFLPPMTKEAGVTSNPMTHVITKGKYPKSFLINLSNI